MAWFRVDRTLRDHPKLMRLAKQLGKEREGPGAVAGYLLMLWCYTATYHPQGLIPIELVEHAACWLGRPGRLVDALCQSGFLDVLTAAEVEVHDWWEKQQALVLKARNDAERMRLKRRESRDCRETGPATVAVTSQRRSHVTGRDGTERYSLETPPPTAPTPVVVEPPGGEGSGLEEFLIWATDRLHGDAPGAKALEWAQYFFAKYQPADLAPVKAAFEDFLAWCGSENLDPHWGLWIREAVWEPRWAAARVAAGGLMLVGVAP